MLEGISKGSISFLALNAMRLALCSMRDTAHFTLAGLNTGQLEHTHLASGLPARTLGCLQRVQLHHLLGSGLDVGGEITGAVFPLDLWVGAGLAIDALR